MKIGWKFLSILLLIGVMNAPLSLYASTSLYCPAAIEGEYQVAVVPGSDKIKVLWQGSAKPYVLTAPESYREVTARVHALYQNRLHAAFLKKEIWVVLQRLATERGHEAGARFCRGLQTPNAVIIVMDVPAFNNPRAFGSLLAHELLHAHFFEQNISVPLWLEEGLASWIQNFIHPGSLETAIQEHISETPWVGLGYSLEELSQENWRTRLSFYGHAFLFLQYAARTHDLFETIQLLDHNSRYWPTLSRYMSQLFVDFSIAKYINSLDYSAPDRKLMAHYQITRDSIKTRRDEAPVQEFKPGSAFLVKTVAARSKEVVTEKFLYFENSGKFQVLEENPQDVAYGQLHRLWIKGF